MLRLVHQWRLVQ